MIPSQCWLGGWGVAPESLRRRLDPERKNSGILVLPPDTSAPEYINSLPDNTLIGGWSLGARLILDAVSAGRISPSRKIVLICPFLGFPAEAGQGGRIAATQVKFLRRWLRKDPLAALADFHRRAGLDEPVPSDLPYSLEKLEAGLDILEHAVPVASPGAANLPSSVRLLGGDRDPLIDNARLRESLPSLKILPAAGHDLRDFLGEILADRDY